MMSKALSRRIRMASKQIEVLRRSARAPQECDDPALSKAIDQISSLLEQIHTLTDELGDPDQELAQVRASLAAERRRYRELFDLAPDGYLVTDFAGTISRCNRAASELLNVTQKYVGGKPLVVFVAEEDHGRFYSFLASVQTAASQTLHNLHLLVCPRRRQRFAADISVSCPAKVVERTGAVRIPEEEPDGIGLLWLIRDVSEQEAAANRLKETASQLERSNFELQQLAFVAAHHFQEPSRVLTTYARLMDKEYRGKLDQTANTYISFLLDAAEQMRSLVQDVLAYGRLGAEGLEISAVDCNELVRAVVNDWREALDRAGGAVSCGPLPTITADRVQLSLVFQNLIGNSIKFCGSAAPRIYISASLKREAWCFSVRDNGIGIEGDYVDRIFEMFERLHKSSEFPGTGVGLAICKKIVQRHGGRIWVQSEPGAGSCFFFTIPVVRAGI